MRILFIGNLSWQSTSLYYYQNLLRLGCAVLPFDPELFRTTGPVDLARLKITKRPSNTKRSQAAMKILSLCRTNRFDLVFVMAENFLTPDLLQAMRKVSAHPPAIIYHSHDNNFADGIAKPADFWTQLKLYDVAFTTKSQNVKRYELAGQPNTYYIPSAFEHTVHRPSSPRNTLGTGYETTFIGTFDHSRDPVFQHTGWTGLRVWGNGWEKSSHYHKQRSQITNHAVYAFEYADILSQSKISLGLLRTEAQDLHTQRTFEIPACGSLQIAPRNSEIQQFFEEGKEIVLFDTLDELKGQCERYLQDEKSRNEMIGRARTRLEKEGHSYWHRTQEILTITAARTQKNWSNFTSTRSLVG